MIQTSTVLLDMTACINHERDQDAGGLRNAGSISSYPTSHVRRCISTGVKAQRPHQTLFRQQQVPRLGKPSQTTATSRPLRRPAKYIGSSSTVDRNGMLRVDDLIAELCLLPAKVPGKKKRKEFQTVELLVRMDCEGCERRVKKALEDMKGACPAVPCVLRPAADRATN